MDERQELVKWKQVGASGSRTEDFDVLVWHFVKLDSFDGACFQERIDKNR
jgi:hypothetical protein